jgi:hypothetical protein
MRADTPDMTTQPSYSIEQERDRAVENQKCLASCLEKARYLLVRECTVRLPPERPGREAYQESKQEVTGKHSAEFPNMAQRAVMQYLSLDDWKIAARLPIPASELMLSRIRDYGWIEIRGEKQHTVIKLTPAGLKAMRSGHLKLSAGL